MTHRIATFLAVVAVVLVAVATPVGVAAAGGPTAAPTDGAAAAAGGVPSATPAAGADAAANGAPTAGSPAGATAGATAAQSECSFPVTVEDATGTEITLEEPPERVVVTAPSAAQTIWELGEEERVVGMPVAPYSAYLDGSQNRTHVLDESGVALDREQIVALEPDLVIAPGVTTEQQVQSLRDANLTVYDQGDSGSIEDIRENVRTTGRLLGACDAANDTVGWMDQRLERVDAGVDEAERPLVYYHLGEGYTAHPNSFQHDLLETAGARNAAANMSFATQTGQLANQEQIVEVNPEHLLLNDGVDVPDGQAIQSTTAIEEDNVLRVNGNYFSQNAPRVVLAVEQIAAQLHPDAAAEYGLSTSPEPGPVPDWTDGNASDPATGNGSESGANATDDGTGDDGASGDGTPGLGVGAALAALAALTAGLAARD